MGKKKKRRREPERSNEELVHLIQQGDDYYMGQLLAQNEGHIRWVYKKLKIHDIQNMDDYLQVGKEGLLHAVSKYDPSRNAQFLTYATPWIKKEMRKLRNKIRKYQRELALTAFDNEKGRATVDRFLESKDPHVLENDVIKRIRTNVIHKCLDTMGPREREFAIYRYGFYNLEPMGRKSIAEYFNIPMQEVFRLEDCIQEYVRESLDVDEALKYLGELTVDPKIRKVEAEAAYENLFSEPADQYLASLVDDFQTEWQNEIILLPTGNMQ